MHLGPGFLSEIHISKQGFSNMASDKLATVLPAIPLPVLKLFS